MYKFTVLYFVFFQHSTHLKIYMDAFESVLRANKISLLDSGCGLIPGCDECTDGLVCKTCKQSFIPVEYERNRKIIIRCTRSCPVGFNITSRQGYSRICIRTELGMLYSKHAIFVASIEILSTDVFPLRF